MLHHAVLIGASKGCGYHALLRLLTPTSNWSATVLLRKPEALEQDANFAPYLKDGRLKIVKGDATNVEDVKKLFVDTVDLVISTVGKYPPLTSHSLYSDFG
jgi:NAD(P)-dependent dehydrogenase (short-subunit alcohol dehydrogenase family)